MTPAQQNTGQLLKNTQILLHSFYMLNHLPTVKLLEDSDSEGNGRLLG